MICSHCQSELPAGAMFCGECGRAVTATQAPGWDTLTEEGVKLAAFDAEFEPEFGFVEAAPVDNEPDQDEAFGEFSEIGADPHCAQCGAELAPDDIFCGACGYVVRTSQVHEIPVAPVARDEPPGPPVEPPVAAVEPPVAADPPSPGDTAVVNLTLDPFPWGLPSTPPRVLQPDDDVDETRIVARRSKGERFVLQFSTGDSVTVYGTGLLGRNPTPEPGEYVDHIVTIIDPGKSVSKTHMEFGQESGAFWIIDRYSGNGSVLREPDSAPCRVDPGKRYRIVRGTRVDIGEQFFIVS